MFKASFVFMLGASVALSYLVQGTYAKERTLVLDLSGEGSCFNSIYSHAGQGGRMSMDEFKLMVTYFGGDGNDKGFENIFNDLSGSTCNHFFDDEVGVCDSQTIPYFAGSRSISETIYLFKVCEQTKLKIIAEPKGPSASPTSSPTAIPSAHPSLRPTQSPTPSPTSLPTPNPSSRPTGLNIPSESPSLSTQPSASPSASSKPSAFPTMSPTVSMKPSAKPSPSPSMSPTVSALPSSSPTLSALPSAVPSPIPSSTPTVAPTPGPGLGPGAVTAISVGGVVAGSAFLYFLFGGLCLAACRRRSNR